MLRTSARSLAAFLALLIVAGPLGCSSEPQKRNAANPLDALRASQKTDRYRQSFWRDAADNKQELFSKAVRFCRQHDFDASTYPNCEYLRGPAMIESTGESLQRESRTDTTEGFGNYHPGEGFERSEANASDSK